MAMWIYYCFLWFCVCINVILSHRNSELCSGDVFESACGNNEVVVVKSAQYGRMKIGRCVKKDLGYIGCQNDALSILDRECSGKDACQIGISHNLHIDAPGACDKDLAGYADISFECVKVLPVSNEICNGREIKFNSDDLLLASSILAKTCPALRKLTIVADPGQRINVSLWSFNSGIHQYGNIQDKMSRNMAQLRSDSRFAHILTSIGNTLEINLNAPDSNGNYLIEMEVVGCPELAPPNGAWMTRDGDVMEIGCHSGSKSWSLTCDNNQWVGVLGQCGTEQHVGESADGQTKALMSVSINVLLFAICSVVILISAVVFLIGVIFLKKNLQQKTTFGCNKYSLPLMDGIQLRDGTVESTNALTLHQNTLSLNVDENQPFAYKSLHVA